MQLVIKTSLVIFAVIVIILLSSNDITLERSGIARLSGGDPEGSIAASAEHGVMTKSARKKGDTRSLLDVLTNPVKKGSKTHYEISAQQAAMPTKVTEGADYQWQITKAYSYKGTVEAVAQNGETYSYSVLLADGEGRLSYQRTPYRTSVRVFYNGKRIAHLYDLQNGVWTAIESTVSGLRCASSDATYPVLQAFGKPLPPVKPLPKGAAQHKTPNTTPTTSKTATTYQSKTDGLAVIYLDFDGEVVNDPSWHPTTVNAQASTFTNAQILAICEAVAEDFITFDVNVTNVRSVFDATPSHRRMMCITTPTDTVSPENGGVAFGDSFTSDHVCWSFINTNVADSADTISHEVGHTVGLDHDGRLVPLEEYYSGHSNGLESWAPIMGGGYGISLSQWSKGDYYQARNVDNEDDFLVMSQTGLTYRAGDYGNDSATAHPVTVHTSEETVEGFIGHGGDVDVFTLTFTGLGVLNVFGGSESTSTNLDLRMIIKDSSNTTLVDYTSDDFKTAIEGLMLQPGTYEITLQGDSSGSPMSATASGWDSYGSVGAYCLHFSPTGIENRNRAIENQATLTDGGDKPWHRQTLTTKDGVDALKSGNISDNQTSTVEVTATTTAVSFFYKVSTEQSFDFFEFYIDGTRVLRLSGEVDWTQYSNTSLTNAAHTFRWVYTKDANTVGGSDSVFLDQLELGAPETTYLTWAAGNSASTNGLADSDHDNAPDLMEYAAGTAPNNASSRPSYCLSASATLEFTRILTRPDLVNRLMVSDDLQNWDIIGVSYNGEAFYMKDGHTVSETALPGDTSKMEYLLNKDAAPKAFGKLEFLRY